MDYKKTGGLIAQIRKEKNLTQKELASLLHISDTTVSKWERGAGFPDVSMIEPLSQALDLSIASLFRGERETEQPPAATENLFAEVLRVACKEIARKKKKYIFWSVAVGCYVLLWAALFLFHPLSKPTLGGFYQSEMINGHCVQISVQPQNNTFAEYIDNRLVNSGTVSQNEDGTYTFKGELKDFTVTLSPENSFDIILVKLVENRLIKLGSAGKIAVYFNIDYGDEEEYRNYLR